MDCQICLEAIKGWNKKIACSHCNKDCCTSCAKTFILSKLSEPVCMHCSKDWNRDFMSNNFTQKFMNKEYKNHRENVLFERQVAMLQETQKEAERRKNIKQVTDEMKIIDAKMKKLRLKKRELQQKKWKLQNPSQAEEEEKVKKEKFYGHCPKEGCRGFINSSWKCGICDTKICKSCKEDITDTEDHTCNPDIVASVRALKSESKPCPKCKIPIIKSSGCRQMWCTQCHVAFDYYSGEIVRRGTIHNPHYLEWQRNNAGFQQPGNACGRDRLPNENFYALIQPFHGKKKADYFHHFNRFLNHCATIERGNYEVDINNYDVGEYLELRIKLLLNQISESEFKTKLQRNEKKVNKKYEIFLVVDMFVETGRDILDQAFRNERTFTGNISKEKMKETKKMVKELINYTNTSLEKIGKSYKNKVPQIILETEVYPRWQNRAGEEYIEFKLA